MKRFTRIIAVAFVLVLAVSCLASCGKPVKESFLVYNDTDYVISALYISATEDPYNDPDAMQIVNLERILPMGMNLNTVLEIPKALHDGEFYIYVDCYGASGLLQKLVPAGRMFYDRVWGLRIFALENGELDIKLLGDIDV